MIKAIIVENEAPHIKNITDLLAKNFPEIDVQAICTSVPDGIDKVKALQPQLLFLDIELPPYTGFDLLEQTNTLGYKVIFTTSHNQYAVKAFRFCALDYIMKPFGIDDLREALNKYKDQAFQGSRESINALLHNVRQSDSGMQKVGIPVLGGLDFLTVSEIIYCKSEDNCTDFFLNGKKKVTATKTLKWVEQLLTEHRFFRVHDSYLINLNHIKKYKKGGEGGVVELSEQYEADVSRRRKEDFLKTLSELNMIFNK